MRLRPFAFVLVLAACSDRPVLVPGDESTGAGDTTASATDLASTSAGTSSDDPTSTAPTSDPTTTGPSATATSSDPGSDTGEPATTGGGVTCGPPCADPWTHDGDLDIISGGTTDALECLTRVTGTLTINGAHDTASLHGLRNLQEVEGLRIEYNTALTDLDAFACLVESPVFLSLYRVPNLVDAAGLADLRSADYLSFEFTGLSALPAFAADFTTTSLYASNNPALLDLDAVAGWTHTDSAVQLIVQLDVNPALTSVAGLAGLIEDASAAEVSVQILGAPALASLAGLEGMTHGTLWLQDLPKVPDLGPLANLVTAGSVSLVGMPQVKDLHGLHNLTVTDQLMIGDCVSFPVETAMGMDGLVDLSGLDALTTAWALWIANNDGMTALTGAPQLATVGGLEVIGNPKLTQPDVDALVAQLDAAPDACFGDHDACMCFQILPW